jgi:hypothetical protein
VRQLAQGSALSVLDDGQCTRKHVIERICDQVIACDPCGLVGSLWWTECEVATIRRFRVRNRSNIHRHEAAI